MIRMIGLVFGVMVVVSGVTVVPLVRAQTTTSIATSTTEQAKTQQVEVLQSKINQRSNDIQSLEEEISQYENQINTLSTQADSLSATIQSLDLTKKKITAEINVTQDKIDAATAAIKKINSQIGDTEDVTAADRRSIESSYRSLNEHSNISVPQILLSHSTVSGTFNALNELGILASTLFDDIAELKQAKNQLNLQKQDKEQAQVELNNLKSQLSGQREAVLSAVQEKNNLLADTKQSQSTYEQILAQKKALKDAFEQEMQAYEESLHMVVTGSEIPSARHGTLAYPLDTIFITQYFGNTSFSTKNPQIYNGKGHDGVDFRASIGTPVKAALSGEVVGVENTDLYPGCYSFGKWIMIKHPNGLSTLYAHLSVQSVQVGDQVSTGQIIGYSGNTGYTTGPHLHFGVYATAGVVIKKFTTSHHCQGAIVPLADWSAYLNPLSYLP